MYLAHVNGCARLGAYMSYIQSQNLLHIQYNNCNAIAFAYGI